MKQVEVQRERIDEKKTINEIKKNEIIKDEKLFCSELIARRWKNGAFSASPTHWTKKHA